MCESNAYIREDDKEVLLMENVSSVEVNGERLLLVDIMGEKKEIDGVILRIDFDEHRFTIKKV